jgi:benzodiazapine receptor
VDKIPSGLVSGVAVLAAAILGAQNGPQRPATAAWYALLRKPAYTPPGPLIGGAWGILELLLSIVGYRLLRSPHASGRSAALCAWLLTLAGLAGYPWLFFRRKRLASSATASSAMLASASGIVIAARKVDEPAAIMTVPLLLWLGLATLLSEELWRRNPHLSRD